MAHAKFYPYADVKRIPSSRVSTSLSKLSSKAPTSPAAPTPAPSPAQGRTTKAAPLSAPASASPPGQAVDVTAVLDALSVKRSEKLNEKLDWRNSTADLMKVLAVESNLQARQELAKELQYKGDMRSSIATDWWLHG